jgi:hypothetical protein
VTGVSAQVLEPKPAAGALELLSITRFQEELRRAARFHSGPSVGSPLDAAVKRIENNPAFTQSRLLTRVLAALAYQEGEFRRAEIAAFDSETLTMVISLMDAHAAGTSTPKEWISAVDSARAAQGGAGG